MLTSSRPGGDHDDGQLQAVQPLIAEAEAAVAAALRALRASTPSAVPSMTFTVAQAAEAIPVSTGTLRRAIQTGELRAERVGRRTAIELTDILDFALRRYQRDLLNNLMRIATHGR